MSQIEQLFIYLRAFWVYFVRNCLFVPFLLCCWPFPSWFTETLNTFAAINFCLRYKIFFSPICHRPLEILLMFFFFSHGNVKGFFFNLVKFINLIFLGLWILGDRKTLLTPRFKGICPSFPLILYGFMTLLLSYNFDAVDPVGVWCGVWTQPHLFPNDYPLILTPLINNFPHNPSDLRWYLYYIPASCVHLSLFSGLSALFHWNAHLFMHQYHTGLTIGVLWYKPNINPPAP